LEGLKIEKRVNQLDAKCVNLDEFIKKNTELVNFKVKVADSCPLAIE